MTFSDAKLTNPVLVFEKKDEKLKKGYERLGFVTIEDGLITTTSPLDTLPTEPCIYWRVKQSVGLVPETLSSAIDSGKTVACIFSTLLSAYPDSAFVRKYSQEGFGQRAAGKLEKQDGVAALLLLMALQITPAFGYIVLLSHEDGMGISSTLKFESQALAILGADLAAVRSVAEAIGLLEKKIDLSLIAPDQADFYF